MWRVDRIGGGHDQTKGGQFVPGTEKLVRFSGALLPMSEKDLRRLPQGTITGNQQKVYTNGFALNVGAEVKASDGLRYVVIKEYEYSQIHSHFRRYIVERKGGAAQK
jgi:hypothetical protein